MRYWYYRWSMEASGAESYSLVWSCSLISGKNPAPGTFSLSSASAICRAQLVGHFVGKIGYTSQAAYLDRSFHFGEAIVLMVLRMR